MNGLRGWIACFEKASFAGSLFCDGINDPGETAGKSGAQEGAYDFGRSLR